MKNGTEFHTAHAAKLIKAPVSWQGGNTRGSRGLAALLLCGYSGHYSQPVFLGVKDGVDSKTLKKGKKVI